MLAAAQQMASISRRLVTTDSYDLPVAIDEYGQETGYGADAEPGLPGVDDDGNGTVDDASELNTVTYDNGSDDYRGCHAASQFLIVLDSPAEPSRVPRLSDDASLPGDPRLLRANRIQSPMTGGDLDDSSTM